MKNKIEKEVKEKLDNIKAKKVGANYELYASIKDYTKYIKYGETYKERLQIFIMLYVYSPTLEELENWTLNKLLDYIKETNNYYNLYEKHIDKCVKLIKARESENNE